MLQHATPEDAKTIYGIFRQYPHIFPHMRFDKVERMCGAGQVIYDTGVIITYQQYRKAVRLGNHLAPRGTTCLHQIVKSADAPRYAASEIFDLFRAHYVPQSLVLSVRADNTAACRFYERHGLVRVCDILWQEAGRPLPGYVYVTLEPSSMRLL
jgi:hypothetical protein